MSWMTYLETNPLQEAFKTLAKGSRTKLLARNRYDAQERERIENIENLTDVCRLGWESHMKPCTKPWITLFCIAWVRKPLQPRCALSSPLYHQFSLLESVYLRFLGEKLVY